VEEGSTLLLNMHSVQLLKENNQTLYIFKTNLVVNYKKTKTTTTTKTKTKKNKKTKNPTKL
jgi:ABC-type phosphate/phosphonate transport system ATPase subunit